MSQRPVFLFYHSIIFVGRHTYISIVFPRIKLTFYCNYGYITMVCRVAHVLCMESHHIYTFILTRERTRSYNDVNEDIFELKLQVHLHNKVEV